MPARVRLRRLVLLPLLVLAVLVGLTALGPVAQAASGARGEKVSRAATIALHQVGDPYRYGASGPNAFDCSGLMQYSFAKAGVRIPRTSAAQAKSAHRIARKKLQRGDLMFFTRGGRVYHAAMFLRWTKGHAVMLHAPGSGKKVRVDRPWTNSWFAGSFR